MEGYTEFYISCNPPLLPIGVSSIVADITKELEESVIEVLYEPENTWFKFISAIPHQPEITRWMHDRLEQLLDTEVCLITDDQDQHDATCLDTGARPDVRVLAETPHVIPYPSFLQISADILEQYDPFRYPDHIKCLPHKRVWQSPEELEGFSVPSLLAKYKPLLPALFSESGLEKLGELTRCQMSHNLRGSMVYIGSDHDVDALDAVTRKLNMLASFMDAPSATTSHFAFTEKTEHAKACYVWTTQIGLSRLTYVDPDCSDLEEQYKRIAGAVTLRVGIANRKGLLAPDSTTYPTESKAAVQKQPGYRPFEGYTYCNKRSGTTAVKEQKRPLACFQVHRPKKSQQAMTPVIEQPSTASKGMQAVPTSCPPSVTKNPVTKPSLIHHPAQKRQTLSSSRTAGAGSKSTFLPPTHIQSRKSVAKWLGDVKCDEPPEAPNKIDEFDDAEPSLIPSLMTKRNKTLVPCQLEEKAGQRPGMSVDQANLTRSEIAPGSSGKPTVLHGALDPDVPGVTKIHKQHYDRANQQIEGSAGQNLMDMFDGPIDTPALMDQAVETSQLVETGQNYPALQPEVVFGKQIDAPKNLFETMNQKSAAPGRSWAKVVSKENPRVEKQNDVNFGQNVRVTDDRRPETEILVPAESPIVQKTSNSGAAFKEKQQTIRSEGVKHGPLHDVPVSTTRVVPGLDTPSTAPGEEECVEIVFEAENKLHDILKVFQVLPGKVSVQAEFGRLCIKGIPPAEVYMNPSHSGPFEFVNAKTRYLNTNNPDVVFSPILTTSVAEANLVPQMTGGRTSWVLVEKHVYYEFLCVKGTRTDDATRLVVNVDADTFAHECLPLAQEVSQAFVHCAQRAWDIKLGVLHRDMAQITDDFEKFAALLVRSLDIKTNEIGEIVIQAEPYNGTEWCVDRVKIRHEARYRNGAKGPSCLTTTMVRVVERFPNTPKGLFKGQSVPNALPGSGRISEWFEARISSIKAEDALQENIGLELGEQTDWSPDKLERHGALRAICEPAILMVRQMDPVGNSNENGHGTETDQPPFDAVKDLRNRSKNYSYW
ncbi:hypothetical protein FLONG3_9270 [Fusarium longipes]|uniref:Uncharacterized protein n=1 Tax=Fusarium longipes TaxID=694270 RepID=A0A395RZ30_9HYPO|nr:hypothetical protein FLONG3_9270 [Fusarium longipes]